MATSIDAKLRTDIIEKCKYYLPSIGHLSDDSIHIRRIVGGYANQTFHCFWDECDDGPNDVIVRFYGSEYVGDDFKINGESGEAIICRTLAEHGMAPRLYGLFSGGRIEEFIKGRNVLLKDYQQDTTFTAIARKMAKFHTIELHISKQPKLLEHIRRSFVDIVVERKVLQSFPREEHEHIENLIAFPMREEYSWFTSIVPKINSKLVFAHNDLYSGNMMLRSNRTSFYDRLMFIDYDITSYFYRGFDIAYFVYFSEYWIETNNNEAIIDFIGDCSIKERKLNFIRDYLQELHNLNVKIDEQRDTFDHLMMEVNCFSLYFYLFKLAFIQSVVNTCKKKMPCEFITHLIKSYTTKKASLFKMYPHVFN